MELKLIPHDKNQFPLKGLLVQGTSLLEWVQEIQAFGQPLADVNIYPIPGTTANSVWGCLVVSTQDIPREKTGRHQGCQALTPTVFIPERATLLPMPTPAELDRLFSHGPYVIHPNFGWVELTEALQLQDLLATPALTDLPVTRPEPSVRMPATIRSFQVQAQTPEAVMANLQNSFPQKKELEDKPLNLWDKTRLGFYRVVFSSGSAMGGSESGQPTPAKPMGKLESFFQRMFNGKSLGRMMQDFTDLEARNKKEIERFLDMLRNNPEEALHYAIPLDQNNTSRGSSFGQIKISRWLTNLSLFDNRSTGGSGGAIEIGDHYYTLQQQYHATAEELVRKNEYHKAAFIYLNLLKDYKKAAETLEAGKYYQEAATLYIKHLNNQQKAAACFEKGNMIHEAIGLYHELGEEEKVGDLYALIANEPKAMEYYGKAVNTQKSQGQYIKAGLICLHKMKNKQATQGLMLEGWRTQRDPVNCLNLYLSIIDEPGQREKEMQMLYRSETTAQNREQFLDVVKHEYKKQDARHAPLKELAYEIIATQIAVNRSIVSELRAFDPDNSELFKDTMRFKINKPDPPKTGKP